MSKSTEDLIQELELGGVLDGSSVPAPPSPTSVATRPEKGSSTVFVLVAIVLIAVIGSLPVVSLALYPFSVFVTLIHESWHAIVTVLTGGTVESIQVSPDLSGQVLSQGGNEPLIASAGYLGASATGAALLVTPLRYARVAIAALAAVPLAALVFFHPASWFTAIWCVAIAIALGGAAWRLNTRFLAFLQVFLGVDIALNALRDLATLLVISSSDSHMQTDAANMERYLFGPSIMWSILWTLVSALLLAAALYHLTRSDLRRLRGR